MDESQRHLQLKTLFLAVCDLPDATAQRTALAQLGADSATQAEVLALLGHADEPTHFSTPLAQAAQALGDELQEGDVLGAWTLQGTLGQGGMGRVYLVERSDGHYAQRAALKLLRGWSGPGASARFTRERQILANLEHPHIARLLDGGTTPAGRPYLVMELVDGPAIDSFCTAQALGLNERLALFDSVCAAVEHAHRQLVIHCDIKPDNVRISADGQAKLLDFGIAQLQGQSQDRSQDPGLDPKQAPSESFGAAFTPGFASPEQMAGQPPAVASDVYGLGCLLRVLLKPLLGQRETQQGGQQTRHRELLAIIAHATAPTPSQRYANVDALRRDLQHWRAHRPVVAMAGGFGYQTGKLLRRRWALATAMSLAAMVLVAFTWQLARERDVALAERQRAENEVQTTRETARLLMSLFTGADPQKMGLPEIPKSIPLAAGRDRLNQQMAADPATRARLQMILGDVYERIGQLPEAAEAFREVAELYGPEKLNQPLAEAEAQRRLALALNNSLRASEAEAPARRGLQLLLQHDPDNLPDIAESQNRLGIAMLNQHRLIEARSLLEQSLALRIRTVGESAGQARSTLHNLARVNRLAGHLEEAERLLKRRLADVKLPMDDGALGSLEEYGTLLSDMQRHTEAEARAREAMAGWAARYGADNSNVGIARDKLAYVLQGAGRLDEAMQELQAALAMELRSHDDTTVRARSMHAAVGRNHLFGGALQKAEHELRLALTPQRRALPPVYRASWQQGLAEVLMGLGRLEEAAPLLEQVLAVHQPLPTDSRLRLGSQLLYAEFLLVRGQSDQARLRLADIQAQLPPQHPQLHQAVWALQGRLAAHEGQWAEAERWLGRAWREGLAWRGGSHPVLLRVGLDLLAAQTAVAAHAAASGTAAAPDAELIAKLQRCAQQHDPSSPWRQRLQVLIASSPATQ